MMCDALAASRSNVPTMRPLCQRATCETPTAKSKVVKASGRPTLKRRGAQASLGRPISVRTIGVPISTPSRSPIHHVAMLNGMLAPGVAPMSQSPRFERLAFTVQDTTLAAKNHMTSRGSLKVNGWRTKRLTSKAPTPACKPAPTPMMQGKISALRSIGPNSAELTTLTQKPPSMTAGAIRQPCASKPANATPAAGYKGEA